jgi:hypothetical protein
LMCDGFARGINPLILFEHAECVRHGDRAMIR